MTVPAAAASSNTSYENGLLRIEDDDGVSDEMWETTAAFSIPTETGETYQDLIAKVQIGGSETFKKAIIDMSNEPQFSTLLSTSVASKAAKVSPLTLKVDDVAWRIHKNSGAARPQHSNKHEFIRETVESMLKLGVIEVFQEPYYSQVHVAPKPHSTDFRFCIDYRALNQATVIRLATTKNRRDANSLRGQEV